jgi:hypothetical protein
MVLSNIGGSSISLADLRSRRVPVEWFEAVAVIQELCRVLVESGGDPAHPSLAPQDVSIDAAGSVRVTSNSARGVDSVVQSLGELLRMSLADSSFPVPLRLVITQSIATPPFYASLAEFVSALDYFERPDRTALIRALYERAQTHQPISGPADPSALPEKPDAPVAPRRHRRRVPTRAIVATVAALTAIAIAVAASQMLTWPHGSVAVVDQLKKAVVDQFKGTVSEQASPDGSSPARPVENRGVTARVSAPPHVATEVVAPLDSEGEPSSIGTPTTTDGDVTGLELVATSEAPVANEADTTIYSASDDDVTPPVATYPRLPARPPASVSVEGYSTIELLVGETGHVESVKFLGRPQNLGEALLVTVNMSAAKTWRFRPALRNGYPVRYRTFMQVWPTTS